MKNKIHTVLYILLGFILTLTGSLTAFRFSPALIGLGAGLILIGARLAQV